MVALRVLAAAVAAFSSIQAVALVQRDDGTVGFAGLDVGTVTVTVTATTCPEQTTATPPVETPATSAETITSSLSYGSGGYTSPPLIPSSSVESSEVPPTTESVIPPPDTTPPPVVPTPVPSSVETSVPIETTPTASTSPATSTESFSITISSSATSATVTPSIPPAVNGAGKADLGYGALVALAVAVFY